LLYKYTIIMYISFNNTTATKLKRRNEMPTQKFTKADMVELRTELSKVIEQFAQNKGVLMEIGKIKYTDTTFEIGVLGRIKEVEGAPVVKTGNIAIDCINQKFVMGGVMYTIIRYDFKKRKYPFIFVNAAGARFKGSHEQIEKLLR